MPYCFQTSPVPPTSDAAHCLTLPACRAKVDARASTTEVVEDFESLREGLQDIIKKLEDFKEEHRRASKLFAFWEEYGTMVDLLLQLIKAERTGNWKLHLCTVAAKVPYFFAMDRLDYSCWLPVYLSNMKRLETKHPRVYQEFMNGDHVVSRTSNPFSQVSTNMALEQSINAHSSKKRYRWYCSKTLWWYSSVQQNIHFVGYPLCQNTYGAE